jgi:hypothetical protein
MLVEELKSKALEIAEHLFASESKYISRDGLKILLKDGLEEYIDLIRNSLCSISKITKKRGQTGGIQFAEERYQQSKLSQSERLTITKKVEQLFQEYSEQNNKPKNEKPEKEVELAFKNWIGNQDKYFKDAIFVRFRSDDRKGPKWENVDGYAIKIETLKYHFSFKPILTSFEVKYSLPNIQDINQARNYLKFSHEVFLIFKYDGDLDSVKGALTKVGFEYLRDGIGVFYTQNEVDFVCVYEAHRATPSDEKVDEKIGKLLTENDLDELLRKKHEYIIEKIFIPAITFK